MLPLSRAAIQTPGGALSGPTIIDCKKELEGKCVLVSALVCLCVCVFALVVCVCVYVRVVCALACESCACVCVCERE